MPPKEDIPSKSTDKENLSDALRKLEGKEEKYKEERAKSGQRSG